MDPQYPGIQDANRDVLCTRTQQDFCGQPGRRHGPSFPRGLARPDRSVKLELGATAIVYEPASIYLYVGYGAKLTGF